jgi:hypothetical protein
MKACSLGSALITIFKTFIKSGIVTITFAIEEDRSLIFWN